MQHLSSRYFNCAIFLLTVKKEHEHPEEAKRLGFRDLDIAKNMDVEVADQCLEVGFTVNKSEHFDLMLSRIRGVLSLIKMGYPDEWGVEEEINDAFREVKRALKNSSSDFFSEISPAGRMQELDVELIKHAQLMNMKEEAAKVGIRMLFEDEYNFHYAESVAVEALVDYVATGGEDFVDEDVKQAIFSFQNTIEAGFMKSFATEMTERALSEENKLSLLNSIRALQSSVSSGKSQITFVAVQQSWRGDFTMEVF
mmetsp:Transcript_1421/g.3924  ORF Transcript_1421/g.3924 Transcript_1421/m.3924 type:complete len:254 (-) Transcript_1421:190-951(-)